MKMTRSEFGVPIIGLLTSVGYGALSVADQQMARDVMWFYIGIVTAVAVHHYMLKRSRNVHRR